MRAMTVRHLVLTLCVPMFTALGMGHARAEDDLFVRHYERETYDAYTPRANDFRLSLFGGAIFSSDRHALFNRATSTQRPFRDANAQLGLRLAYFPDTYFGAELEGTFSPASAGSRSADVIAPRAHLMAQLPGRLSPFVVAGAGARIVRSGDRVLGNDADPAGHWGVGARYQITEQMSARVDTRHVIAPALGSSSVGHDFELLAGLGVRWGLSGRDSPDIDGDGIANLDDACPRFAGEGSDGCPADKDNDGFADASDLCPNLPGTSAWDGCPNPDADQDGVALADDLCPEDTGTLDNGCLTDDVDFDGVIAANDQCPNVPETRNGFEDDDGCPDVLPQEIAQFEGTMEGITFKTGSAEIAPSSYVNLDKVLAVLRKYDGIQVKIDGHTDDTGTDATNFVISKQRAQSVRRYLLKKGIDKRRIAARGYGEDKPIAPNDSPDNRKKNRRIEFTLVQ